GRRRLRAALVVGARAGRNGLVAFLALAPVLAGQLVVEEAGRGDQAFRGGVGVGDEEVLVGAEVLGSALVLDVDRAVADAAERAVPVADRIAGLRHLEAGVALRIAG